MNGPLEINITITADHLTAGGSVATSELSAASDDPPFYRLLKDLTADPKDVSESMMSLLAALLTGSALSNATPAPATPTSNLSMTDMNEAVATAFTGNQLDTADTNHPSSLSSNEELPQPLITGSVPDPKIQLIDAGLQHGNAQSADLPAQRDMTALSGSLPHQNQQTPGWDPQRAQRTDLATMPVLQAEDRKTDGAPLLSNAPHAATGPLLFDSAQVSDPSQSLEHDLLAASARSAQESRTTCSADDDNAMPFDRREEPSSVVPVQTGDAQKDSFVAAHNPAHFPTVLHASLTSRGEQAVVKGPTTSAPTTGLPQGLETPQGATSVHLEVQPPDLGRVRVHVALAEQRVYATVITEQAELRDFLMKNQGRLQADLNTYGLDVGGFRVAVDPQGHGWSDPSWLFAYDRGPEGRPGFAPVERALPRQVAIGVDPSELFGEDRLVNLFV